MVEAQAGVHHVQSIDHFFVISGLNSMDRNTLEKMLAQGQDSPLLRYTLGSLCLKQGDAAEAAQHLEAALRQQRDHSASWKAYGKALTALERLEDARAAYAEGIVIAEAKGDIQAVKEMKVFLKRLGGK
jgi:uncharacterized protein HemY